MRGLRRAAGLKCSHREDRKNRESVAIHAGFDCPFRPGTPMRCVASAPVGVRCAERPSLRIHLRSRNGYPAYLISLA